LERGSCLYCWARKCRCSFTGNNPITNTTPLVYRKDCFIFKTPEILSGWTWPATKPPYSHFPVMCTRPSPTSACTMGVIPSCSNFSPSTSTRSLHFPSFSHILIYGPASEVLKISGFLKAPNSNSQIISMIMRVMVNINMESKCLANLNSEYIIIKVVSQTATLTIIYFKLDLFLKTIILFPL